MKVTVNNNAVDFDAAVNLMDSEIIEQLNSSQDWAEDAQQAFVDAYVVEHAKKYGGENFVAD